MADIVNLRRVRKAKQRRDQAAMADATRIQHGLSKADRTVAAKEQARAVRRLEAHRRADDTDAP